MIPGVVTTTNYTGVYGPVTVGVPYPPKHPDLVEFGKSFDMPVTTVDDPLLVQATYDIVLKDYFKEKAKSFPTWSGLPEVKVAMVDSLKRSYQVAWYVAIPQVHVVDLDQQEEEALWEE